MEMGIASITDPTTATGLRLAGIEDAYEAEDREETEVLFEKLTEEEGIGLLIMTEGLAEKIREKIDKLTDEREGITPILAEIPDKRGPIPERKEVIRKLIKRAVGVEIKT